MGYYSYSTMGGFEVGRDTEEKPKDKTLTEAVSYIYEDVKDIMGRGREEAKRNQGIMAKTSQPESDEDDKSSIVSNVTNTARAFLSMLGKARPPSVNPLVGVATGITAGLIPDTGTTGAMQPTVSEQIETSRRIDKPFDYSKVYKQYLEPRLGGAMQRPTITTQTQAALGGPIRRPQTKVDTTVQVRKDERTRIINKLAMSESSNDFSADNELGYIGRLQFGEDRLKDFTDATGKNTTDFLNNPELQKEVEQWHIKDLESFIRQNSLQNYYGEYMKGFFVDKDSIIAMAHLGGATGTIRFLKNKGMLDKDGDKTDTQDAYGTKLSDYGKKFSNSSAPQTSPIPVRRPTNIVVSEDTTDTDEMERINFEDIPIEQLLDPSTYLFGTNDREEKIKILREVYGIFIEVV